MNILNLTQHPASEEQKKAGVYEPADKKLVQELLTFTGEVAMPDVEARAKALVNLALSEGAEAAMIGGAPYLMGPLHACLKEAGVRPLYSFTERESVETTAPDGSVVKTSVFKHRYFIG